MCIFTFRGPAAKLVEMGGLWAPLELEWFMPDETTPQSF